MTVETYTATHRLSEEYKSPPKMPPIHHEFAIGSVSQPLRPGKRLGLSSQVTNEIGNAEIAHANRMDCSSDLKEVVLNEMDTTKISLSTAKKSMDEPIAIRRRVNRGWKASRSLRSAIYLSIFVLCFLSGTPHRNDVKLHSTSSWGSVLPLFSYGIPKIHTFCLAQAETTTADLGNQEETKEKLNITLRKAKSKNMQGFSTPKPAMGMGDIFRRAAKKGLGGGIPGAMAGAVQVLTLMWIRTIINYQYRYGTTFRQAFKTLLNQGGFRRFYKGVGFALIQNPLAKFGSTAANDGVAVFLSNLSLTSSWGPGRRTMVGSLVVALWRIFLMPIDTCKTVLQVDSTEGFKDLMRKVRAGKVNVLYEGAVANAIASAFSFYPWFYMYNRLSNSQRIANIVRSPLLRNAMIGFMSSVVSDTATNFLRVIKTTKQAMARKHSVGYGEAISMILAADGIGVSSHADTFSKSDFSFGGRLILGLFPYYHIGFVWKRTYIPLAVQCNTVCCFYSSVEEPCRLGQKH